MEHGVSNQLQRLSLDEATTSRSLVWHSRRPHL